MERHNSVYRCPECLRHLLWIVGPRAEPPGAYGGFGARSDYCISVALRHCFQGSLYLVFIAIFQVRRHELQAVDLRVVETKLNVCHAEFLESFNGVTDSECACKRGGEAVQVGENELLYEGSFVSEMVIDGGSTYTELSCDSAHGGGLDALADEELPGGIQDASTGIVGVGGKGSGGHGEQLNGVKDMAQG